MSRTIIGLVVVGVAVLAAALGVAWQSMQSEKAVIGTPTAGTEPKPAAAPTTTAQSGAAAPQAPASQAAAPQAATPQAATPQAATPQAANPGQPQQAAPQTAPQAGSQQAVANGAVMVPTFDVVRVGQDGRAVIAGRAAAKAKVVLLDGGKETAWTTTADDRGEWVLTVQDPPFTPGQHELRIVQHIEGRAPVTSEQAVMIVVPEPAEKEKQTLVMIDPPRGPTTLVQPPTTAGVPRSGDLAVSTVDYDERGIVTVSGQATPGGTVRIYIDDTAQGEAAAGNDGRWRVTASEAITIGKHKLRVDRLAKDGKPEGRLEMDFERKVMAAGADGRKLHIVVGDNLWNIARAHYGEGWRYTVIFQANKDTIRDPNLIYPGQVFALPKSN
jgi:hypothetical protein